ASANTGRTSASLPLGASTTDRSGPHQWQQLPLHHEGWLKGPGQPQTLRNPKVRARRIYSKTIGAQCAMHFPSNPISAEASVRP
ncbi:hypothetical protein R0J89_19910, partial [Psychrobacter sp. SIMBA_152]